MTNIASILRQDLRSRFPELELCMDEEAGITSFPFPPWYPGRVLIRVEGLEIAIQLGDITHGHFDACCLEEFVEGATGACERAICHQVCEFLEDLFRDRILLWRTRDGMAGGWRYLDSHADSLEEPLGDCECFRWSGPLNPPGDSHSQKALP